MNEHNQDEQKKLTPEELSDETKALLQLIEMSRKEIEEGNYQDADSFFEEMKKE